MCAGYSKDAFRLSYGLDCPQRLRCSISLEKTMNNGNSTFCLRLLRCAAIALVAMASASALKAADTPMRFGVGVQMADPGDLLAFLSKRGFGVQLFGEMDLSSKTAIRGRLDYNLFGARSQSESNPGYYEYEEKITTTATTVFVDYIYRAGSHDEGLYVFGGLGLVKGSTKIEAKVWYEGESASDSLTKNGSNFGYSVGIGVNFTRNIAVEASLTSASDVIPDMGVFSGDKLGLNWTQVSFKYRF